jgi:hypothetical protein
VIDSIEVSGLSENEAAKAGKEKANELLRSGRLVFLTTAGYTEADILGFGDLAMLRSERMTELLHRKAVEAFGNALGKTLPEKDLEVNIIGGKKRKKK